MYIAGRRPGQLLFDVPFMGKPFVLCISEKISKLKRPSSACLLSVESDWRQKKGKWVRKFVILHDNRNFCNSLQNILMRICTHSALCSGLNGNCLARCAPSFLQVVKWHPLLPPPCPAALRGVRRPDCCHTPPCVVYMAFHSSLGRLWTKINEEILPSSQS